MDDIAMTFLMLYTELKHMRQRAFSKGCFYSTSQMICYRLLNTTTVFNFTVSGLAE